MYEKRYMKYFSEHSSTENWTWKSRWHWAPLSILLALTRQPLTQKLNKYCIFNCKKLVYLLSKANGVYRVESLIFRKNILMSWLIDENKMVKELRSSKTIASRVGGVCWVGRLPSLQCSVKSVCWLCRVVEMLCWSVEFVYLVRVAGFVLSCSM